MLRISVAQRTFVLFAYSRQITIFFVFFPLHLNNQFFDFRLLPLQSKNPIRRSNSLIRRVWPLNEWRAPRIVCRTLAFFMHS